MAELTDVRTGRSATRTIAVESEDPALVLATVEKLGLAAHPNVNFGRGLRILERFGVERFAVIDVGTNSVKFHLAERGSDGSWQTIVDRAAVTRLGEGLQQSGRLGPEPMARTVEAIAGMVDEARLHQVGAIAAVGTAGLRIAENAAEFVEAVERRCGVRVEVISGEDEARLAYRAATTALPTRGPSVVFDTGGGSSQFTFGQGDRVEERFSVEVGAVRFTEQFGLDDVVDPETVAEARSAIASDLDRLDGRDTPETLLAMGGAVTNLAAVRHGLDEYDADVVQGTVLDRAEIDRQIELYRSRSADERREIAGLQPERAEVILAGACIVRTVLDKLGKESLTVSDRGLRYGVRAEKFDQEPRD
jgi:exopolyphosphatase/guanosine-5'-triphosphate,3'-diphosphate pyrophosphatase